MPGGRFGPGYGGGQLGPAPVYDSSSARSRAYGSPTYFGPADASVTKRRFAKVGKANINLVDPRSMQGEEGQYVPIDGPEPTGPLAEIQKYYSSSTPGGFFSGLFGAAAEIASGPAAQLSPEVKARAAHLGSLVGKTIEAPLGFVGGLGVEGVPFIAPAIDSANSFIEEHSPYILRDTLRIPKNLGGAFQSALNVFGLLGRAVERTYAGFGHGEGGFLNRGSVLPADIQTRVDSGELTHDQGLDELVMSGRGFTEDPWQNMVFSILTDPANWATLGVGAVAGAAKGTLGVARVFSQAALREGGAVARMAGRADEVGQLVRMAQKGESILDVPISRSTLTTMRRGLNEDIAERLAMGEDIPNSLKLSLSERFGMSALGPVRDTATETAVFRVANGIAKATDPINFFSGRRAGQRSMEQLSIAASTGVMAALKPSVVNELTSVADDLIGDGSNRIYEGISTWGGNALQEYGAGELASQAMQEGAIPKFGSLTTAEAIRSFLTGGAYDTNVGKFIEIHVEKTKNIRVATLPAQQMYDETVAKLARILDVDPQRVAARVKKVSPDMAMAVHGLYYYRKGTELHTGVAQALSNAASNGTLPKDIKLDDITMITPRRLTNLRAKALAAALKAKNVDEVRAITENYDDFNWMNRETVPDGEVLEAIGSWLDTNLDTLPQEVALFDPATGLMRTDLPPELARWAEDADEFGYGLANGMPADAPLEAQFRLTYKPNGSIRNARPWLPFWASGDFAAKKLSRWQTFHMSMLRGIRGERILWDQRRRFITDMASEDAGNVKLPPALSDRLFKALMFEAQEGHMLPRGMAPEQMMSAANRVLRDARNHSMEWDHLAGRLTERQIVLGFLRAMEGDVALVGVTQKLTGKLKSATPIASQANFWGQLSEKLYPLMRFTLNPIFMGMELTEPYILDYMRGIRLPLSRNSEKFQQGLATHNAVRQLIYGSRGPDGLLAESSEMNALRVYQAAEAQAHFGPTTWWGRFRSSKAKVGVAERKQAAAGLQTQRIMGDHMYRAFKEIKGDAFDDFWGRLEYEAGTTDRGEIAMRWVSTHLGVMDRDGHKVAMVSDLMLAKNLGQRLRLSTDGARAGDYTYADVEELLDIARLDKGYATPRRAEQLKAGEALVRDLKTMTQAEWLDEVKQAGLSGRVGRISEHQADDIWRLANGPEVKDFWKGYRDAVLRGVRGPSRAATRALRDEAVNYAQSVFRAWAKGKNLTEEEFIKLHFDDIPRYNKDVGVLPPEALTDIRPNWGYEVLKRSGAERQFQHLGVIRNFERMGRLDDPLIADTVSTLRQGSEGRGFYYVPLTPQALDRMRQHAMGGFPTTLATRWETVGTDPVRAITRYGNSNAGMVRVPVGRATATRESPKTNLKRVKSHDFLLDEDLDMLPEFEVLTPEGWKRWDEYATREGVPEPRGLGAAIQPGPEMTDQLDRLLGGVFGEAGETYPWGIDFRDILTVEELGATKDYAGIIYKTINSYLRGLPLPDGAIAMSDMRIDELTNLLDATIQRGVLRERKQVQRGIATYDPQGFNLSSDPEADLRGVYDKQVGEYLEPDPGFLSTTGSEETARDFAYSSGDSVIITYDLPAGTPMNLIEGSENEFLLGRDIQWRVVERSRRGPRTHLTVVPVKPPELQGLTRDMLGSPPLHQRNMEIMRQLAVSDPDGLRQLAARANHSGTSEMVESAIAAAEAARPQRTLTVGSRRFGPLTPRETLDDITTYVDENDIPSYATKWADLRGRIEELLSSTSESLRGLEDDDEAFAEEAARILNSNDMRVLASLGAAMGEHGGRQSIELLLRTMEGLWKHGLAGAQTVAGSPERAMQVSTLISHNLLRGLKHPMTSPRLAPHIDDAIDVLLNNSSRRTTGRTDLLQPIVRDDAAYEGAGFMTQRTLDDLGMEVAPPTRVTAPVQEPVMTGPGTQFERGLGGTTGADLVRGPDGVRYVEKRGTSAEHILEEGYANDVYEAMGVPVPRHVMHQEMAGPVQRANYIEGTPLAVFERTASPEELAAVHAQLADGFALDSLLANWDAMGLEGDNVIIKGGVAYRIDNGGSLRFRAQGAPKGERFGTKVGELDTLRDPNLNEWGAKVYDGLSEGDIRRQVLDLDARRATILAALPPELRDVISARLDDMLRQTEFVVPTPAPRGMAADVVTDDTHAYLVHHYNEVATLANEAGLGGHKQWTAADMAVLAGRAREEMGRTPTTPVGVALEDAIQQVPANVYFPPGSTHEWMNPLLDLLNRTENRAARDEFMTSVTVPLLQSLRDRLGIVVDGLDVRGIGIWDAASDPQPLVPLMLLSSSTRGDDLADVMSYVMQQAEVMHFTKADPAELARTGAYATHDANLSLVFSSGSAKREAEDVARMLGEKLDLGGMTATGLPDGRWRLDIIDREGTLERLADGQVNRDAVGARVEAILGDIGERQLDIDLHVNYGTTYVAGPRKLPDGTYDWEGHLDATEAALAGRGSTIDRGTLDGLRSSHHREVEDAADVVAPQNLDRARRREPLTEVLEDRRGGQTFGTTTPNGATASVIRAFGAADPLTGLHELIHAFSISGMDPSLRDVVSRSWDEHVTAVEQKAAALEAKAAAHTNKSAATRLRNDANALRAELGTTRSSAWGKAQEEHFVKLVMAYIDRGVPPTPELANAFEHFRNWVQLTRKSLNVKGMPPVTLSPQMENKLGRLFQRPGVETVPYSIEQETMRQAMRQIIKDAYEEAHTTQFYKPGRSMMERSINHPYIGMYPASYMWGKVLPEMVRFLALRPFGMTTPFLGWNVLREVSDSIRSQSENDPAFKQFLADNEDFFMFLSMFFPALPNDIPANASLPLRRIAEQGLEHQATYAAGGTPEKDIEVLRGAQDALMYAVGPLGTIRTVGQVTGMAGGVIGEALGVPQEGEAQKPGELLPLR